MAKMEKSRLPDNLIALKEACEALPSPLKPDRTTVWRWTRGRITGGVRLKTWRILGRLYTTHAALEEFIGAVTIAPEDGQPSKAKPRKSMAIA